MDNASSYDDATIEAVLHNFYADDLLKSVRTSKAAIHLAHQLTDLLQKGGFRLNKWISNSRAVMAALPPPELATPSINLDLDDLAVERALGVYWDVERDEFTFNIALNCTNTKQGVLKAVSSIFDPLGFLAPFIFNAKHLLQELWRHKLEWDQEISGRELETWQAWKQDLLNLAAFRYSRCFEVRTLEEAQALELHVFADASEMGFAAVAYLRLSYPSGRIACSFLMAKSRLAPLRPLTTPRLELQAAVMAVRLGTTLLKELDLTIHEVLYWSDSMTTLQYIHNETRRFHTFVANRVAEIHESSKPHQWLHVPGALNPADDATKGLPASYLVPEHRWLRGPDFLWKDRGNWPTQVAFGEPKYTDPDVKKPVEFVAATTSSHSTVVDSTRYSTLSCLLRVTAWVRRFISNSRSGKLGKSKSLGPLKTEELEHSLLFWVRKTQQEVFSDEISSLQRGEALSKRSPLLPLQPFLQDGYLRLGGRLNRAPIPYEARHQLISPHSHHVTTLVILDSHVRLGHAGTEHVLSSLRQRFWIVKAKSAIRQTIHSCLVCKRRTAAPAIPMMSALPSVRLDVCAPVFANTGVDYFGPMMVRRGRGTEKQGGCLFTCLTSRAVHLELAGSLSTDSFLLALRRFVARRGAPKCPVSDNGTNFVGAARELRECIRSWNQEQISAQLSQKGIQWKFNPPSAPHFGGVWERMVRSTKTILRTILGNQYVNHETLSTLMTEVEAILNSRPLTPASDDPNDLEAITPNHFLLGRASPNLPPGVFYDSDLCSRKRWKQAQIMARHFWLRFIREYLPRLTSRPKWNQETRPLRENDMVLLVEDNTPRGLWPLGRIVRVLPGPDGRIRTVEVRTKSGVLTRPAAKLCLLEEAQK